MEVESGHLQDIDWEDGTLSITFRDGSRYEYADVPNGVFQEMLGAYSKSEFFRQNVKGVFEFTRIK